MDEEKQVKKQKIERPVFEGFNATFKGFSQLPNDWLDEITSQIDNIAELKVVLYVYRHTWGFQEKKSSPDAPAKHDEIKHITTDEFMHGRKKADGTRMDRGTGLSNRSVIDGLRNAVKHGYILEIVNDNDKGRIVKSYALKMIKTAENSCEESSQDPVKNPHRRVSNSHSNYEESSHRTEKETRERNLEKERGKESTSIHSLTLSDDSLDKIRELAEGYENDVSKCQQRAQEIYQEYVVSDDDFYNYFLEAYRRTKSDDMAGVFTQLQLMLHRYCKKREQ